MEHWNKVFRDFDRCHDYDTDTDKLCKDCNEKQRQRCEAETNLTENKPYTSLEQYAANNGVKLTETT